MNSKVIKIAMLWMALASAGFYHAQSTRTRMEAQVAQAKQQFAFEPVNGLWHPDANFPLQKVAADVKQASFLTLDKDRLGHLMSAGNKGLLLPVTVAGGQQYELEMVRYDHFSDDFKVFTQSGNTEKTVKWTPGAYYSGAVKGIPGSMAVFSFFENQVFGTFSIPGTGNFILEPNGLNKTGENLQYILYNDADLTESPSFSCGAESFAALRKKLYKTNAPAANTVNTCKDLELFLVADYDFYFNQNSSITQLTNFVTSFYNVSATIYRNEGIELSIKALQINTTPDVYQSVGGSSLDFLNKFGSVTQNNLHGADVAVLLSTRYGSLGGIAFLDVLCSEYRNDGTYHAGPYAYCNVKNDVTKPFPVYSWNAMVLAHEIGHSIGSPHTHSCTWPGGPIDKCYTIEDGPCDTANVPLPTNGGTIMSYCHLRPGIGINMANGFGPLPGNLIRQRINSASCVTPYYASNLLAVPGSSVAANRECTDDEGVTHYWNDNNSTSKNDDILVLLINKKGQNIGSVTDSAFALVSYTTPAYGSGSGNVVFFPTGNALGNDSLTVFNRYWKAMGTKDVQNPIEVIYPYSKRDMIDLENGSPIRFLASKDMKMYTVKKGVDPNPGSLKQQAVASDIQAYGYSNSASLNSWTYSDTDTLMLAHLLTSNWGGGTAVIPTLSARSLEVLKGIVVFPNPAASQWTVWVPRGTQDGFKMSVFAADGRLIMTQNLNNGALNPVDASGLARGMYLMHVSGEGIDQIIRIVKQ